MSSLFNIDNPVWRFLGKLVDMLLLTGLWVLCSLPLVTIGASTCALYYVTLKLADNKEGYIASSFFKAFKENLRQGVPAGLLAAAAGVILAVDFYVAFHVEGQAGILLFWAFLVLAVIFLMTTVYLFPLMARCKATLPQLCGMAFVMSMKNFGWTLLMLVGAACMWAVGLFVMAPLLVFAIGGTAYLHAKILNMLWRGTTLELA